MPQATCEEKSTLSVLLVGRTEFSGYATNERRSLFFHNHFMMNMQLSKIAWTFFVILNREGD